MLNDLDQICANEKTEICSDNHLTKNVDEEIDATIVFEKEVSNINEVLQHPVEDKELDEDFSSHEMKIEQSMVPATYDSSSIINSNIKVLSLERHFSDLINAKYEQNDSVLIESMDNKEPSNFIPAYPQSDDCLYPSQENKEHVENGDACFSSGSKLEVIFDNACKRYDDFSLLEDFQYSDFVDHGLNINISTKDDNRENRGDNARINRLDYNPVAHLEYGEYPLPLKKIECASKDIHESIDESDIYGEAWLFGKVLWVIRLQITFGLKFNNEGVARGYHCYFKLVEHLPLFRKGSYFSLSINGHV